MNRRQNPGSSSFIWFALAAGVGYWWWQNSTAAAAVPAVPPPLPVPVNPVGVIAQKAVLAASAPTVQAPVAYAAGVGPPAGVTYSGSVHVDPTTGAISIY